MSDVTRILSTIRDSDPRTAAELLPLVYDELRRLASQWLRREKPGQTLQPTALVHEAFVRLVKDEPADWADRKYFFAAAAEAMRRILIENARHKKTLKRGGDRQRMPLEVALPEFSSPCGDIDELLDLSDALDAFAVEDPAKAELVKLRFFGGFSLDEVAATMGIPRTTADQHLRYARAWLHDAICTGRSGHRRPPHIEQQ